MHESKPIRRVNDNINIEYELIQVLHIQVLDHFLQYSYIIQN
jgi:hypothetical protein